MPRRCHYRSSYPEEVVDVLEPLLRASGTGHHRDEIGIAMCSRVVQAELGLRASGQRRLVCHQTVASPSVITAMAASQDHYVNIPMSTGRGDFGKPSAILFYSERTPDYDGEPVKGVDKVFEVTGDFVSAVLRVMPHAAEPGRLEANRAAMHTVKLEPLSEFLGQKEGGGKNLDLQEDLARFPKFRSDFEIFENRFLEVMRGVRGRRGGERPADVRSAHAADADSREDSMDAAQLARVVCPTRTWIVFHHPNRAR